MLVRAVTTSGAAVKDAIQLLELTGGRGERGRELLGANPSSVPGASR
jgi:hypothetical protein